MNQRLESLLNKINTFNKNLEEIGRRRQHWQEITKPTLITTLVTINKAFAEKGMPWQVECADMFQNWENVYWSTGDYSSGITYQKGNDVRTFAVQPGCLTFSQTETGEIFCYISFPYIDLEDLGSASEQEDKFLGRHLPEDLTEEIIYNYAHAFVDAMTHWWLNENTKIGYRPKGL